MPTRAPFICGCGRTVAGGAVCLCRKQRKAEADAARPSAAQRGYDAAWRRCRADFLKRNPMCCKPGCDKPATDADHIVSLREQPDLRLSWSNLRPFCHAHHSQRTARDQGFGRGDRGVGRNLAGRGWDRDRSTPRETAESGFPAGGEE